MTRPHLASIFRSPARGRASTLLACALCLGACAKKGSAPPAEDAHSSQSEALPEPTDNSALDESDETPEQPDGTPPP